MILLNKLLKMFSVIKLLPGMKEKAKLVHVLLDIDP